MCEWTQDQVETKRNQMIKNRAKRLTPEKVAIIRKLYSDELFGLNAIAKQMNVCTGSIHLVIKNRCHVDDNYTPPARNSKLYLRLLRDSAIIAQYVNHARTQPK